MIWLLGALIVSLIGNLFGLLLAIRTQRREKQWAEVEQIQWGR